MTTQFKWINKKDTMTNLGLTLLSRKAVNLYIVLVGLIMLEDKLSSVPSQFHFDSCSICKVGQPFNGLFDSNRLYPLAKTPHLWVLPKRIFRLVILKQEKT
ncbi:hypothetical protein V1477_001520 [Vespula maculifrons]|uniref:Uncharacterized protein n=1 Tax=Vespula maculifrons TaxID=7453 RepID=A0ABD2CYM5_VESMC